MNGVVLGRMRQVTLRGSIVLIYILAACCGIGLVAQEVPRAGQPIILEWADSLVGTGAPSEGLREFVGNVRFRQGNVTVTCDRAVHHTLANTADFFGNVIVRQDNMVFTSPQAQYNGNSRMAYGQGGITIKEGTRTVKSARATYSTADRIAQFDEQVVALDDTMQVWSDHAVYYRQDKRTVAWGNVVAFDTVALTRVRGDSIVHIPSQAYLRIMGSAAVWDWDTSHVDTMYLVADTINQYGGNQQSMNAYGEAAVTSGRVAARADSISYSDINGVMQLWSDPVLWADSTELIADTINVIAPSRKLSRVIGVGNGMIVSRQDTVHPDRFDQISGRLVALRFAQDTLREITAIDNAKSITFRTEDERGEGVARMASDTIKALFDQGALVDVFWLGGIQGEHQPEHLLTGRESSYRLPGFEWRTDKPVRQPLPYAGSPPPQRTSPRIRTPAGATNTSVKKQ